MIIDKFYIDNYEETRGREGYGFIATLMYNGHPYAQYEDYATGAMADITLLNKEMGVKEIKDMMKKVKASFSSGFIEYLDIDDYESCIEFLCYLLLDGKDIEDYFAKVKKRQKNSMLLITLFGYGNTFSPETKEEEMRRTGAISFQLIDPQSPDRSTEEAGMITYFIPPKKEGEYNKPELDYII